MRLPACSENQQLEADLSAFTGWDGPGRIMGEKTMLNRRTALAMATMPALAVPVTVAAMDAADAELLNLDKQLDQVIADYNAQQWELVELFDALLCSKLEAWAWRWQKMPI
jgi:hypothetical protein